MTETQLPWVLCCVCGNTTSSSKRAEMVDHIVTVHGFDRASVERNHADEESITTAAREYRANNWTDEEKKR